MATSRYTLQKYPTLAGDDTTYYFSSRAKRDEYFLTATPTINQLTAINTKGLSAENTDWGDPVWEVDVYNGTNWYQMEVDPDFALVITNDGLRALTDAKDAKYVLEVSRIIVKQTPIPAGIDIANLTHNTFVSSATSPRAYSDVCLDTFNVRNTTFTIEKNLSARTNLLNGGLQFTLELDLNCLGQESATQSSSVNPTLTQYDVGCVGLYVKNQNEEGNSEKLFAVASLPSAVKKLTTTPTTIGNAIKLYLNTTLSNLGNVANITSIQSSVGSIPEVADESDLVDSYDGINAPYNIYVVDDYAGTNIPALAIRKGNPTSPVYPVTWTYFTPTDDNIYVEDDLISKYDAVNNPTGLKDYMVAAWNGSIQKYVPADPSDHNLSLAGLYVRNHIIYAGRVNQNANTKSYTFDVNTTIAENYLVGDILICARDGATFTVQIINVDPSNGKPTEWYITPKTGMVDVNTPEGEYWPLAYTKPNGTGLGLTIHIETVTNTSNIYTWNFNNSYINKPLYVSKTNPGEISTTRSGQFVGWCLGPQSIKMGLDLRNEATNTVYGTTRYANEETAHEVGDVYGNQTAKNTTSITPETAQANYIQRTCYANNPGYDAMHPIDVDTYIYFKAPIYGRGIDPSTLTNNGDPDSDVSFYGVAYRATWADLAEYYKADKHYAAGTLICFGDGFAEITEAKNECNGVISTKPGYILGEKKDENDLPVALVGKVPVLFDGQCVPRFGDRIYLSKLMPGRASTKVNGKCLGKIIDKREHLDQYNAIDCVIKIAF